MSSNDGPVRRRRIAGEPKPSDARVPTPAKKVVRKPVARPGAPATPADPAPERADVETPSDAVETPVAPDEVEAPVEGTPGADATADAPSTPRRAPRVGRRPRPTDDLEPATTTVDDGDATTTTPEKPAASTRRRPPAGRIALVALTVACLAFGAVFGVRGALEWRESRSIDSAHEQAAEAAATAAETIFTYRYDQLEQYLEDSKDVMTSSFAQDFETISPALSDLAPQRKIQVEATTRDSGPINCGDDCRADETDVLLFVDQARLADGSEVPTVFGNRVRMRMVERDGRWLVDDITAL